MCAGETNVATTRDQYLIVDSRHRNYELYPNPSKYAIDLNETLADVYQMALIQYSVPTPQYTIHSGNNRLHLLTVPPNYDVHTKLTKYNRNMLNVLEIEPGYYFSTNTLKDHPLPPGSLAETYSSEQGILLQQDALAMEMERLLCSASVPRCAVFIDPRNHRYTIYTDFILTESDTEPTYFQPMFGCGATIDCPYCSMHNTLQPLCSDDDDGCTPPNLPTNCTCQQRGTYLKGSVGRVVGFPPTTVSNRLTGRIDVSSDIAGVLKGSGTAFTQEVRTGDWLFVMQTNGESTTYARIQVDDVDNDHQLQYTGVLNVLPDAGEHAATTLVWNGRIEAPWVRNTQPAPYVLLNIDGCETLQSTGLAANARDPFFLIPVGDASTTAFTTVDGTTPVVKHFAHPIGRLERLRIEFVNEDGTEYDFMGRDHTLIFQVKERARFI